MEDRKQILTISETALEVSSRKILSVYKNKHLLWQWFNNQVVFLIDRFSYISLQEWLILLLLNIISFSFLGLAYYLYTCTI